MMKVSWVEGASILRLAADMVHEMWSYHGYNIVKLASPETFVSDFPPTGHSSAFTLLRARIYFW